MIDAEVKAYVDSKILELKSFTLLSVVVVARDGQVLAQVSK